MPALVFGEKMTWGSEWTPGFPLASCGKQLNRIPWSKPQVPHLTPPRPPWNDHSLNVRPAGLEDRGMNCPDPVGFGGPGLGSRREGRPGGDCAVRLRAHVPENRYTCTPITRLKGNGGVTGVLARVPRRNGVTQTLSERGVKWGGHTGKRRAVLVQTPRALPVGARDGVPGPHAGKGERTPTKPARLLCPRSGCGFAEHGKAGPDTCRGGDEPALRSEKEVTEGPAVCDFIFMKRPGQAERQWIRGCSGLERSWRVMAKESGVSFPADENV